MNTTHRLITLLLFIIGSAACSSASKTPPASDFAATDEFTLKGSLNYRERIALTPDALITLTLSDISLADRTATVITEKNFASAGRQVPVPFELKVASGALQPGRLYALRASIRDPQDRLLWSTDVSYLMDTSQALNEFGTLELVRVAANADKPASQSSSYICGTTPVSARYQQGGLKLTVADAQYTLSQVPSASGSKFQTPANAPVPVLFWEKGPLALLEINGERYPQCHRHESQNAPLPVNAHGNEPAWLLEITTDRIELISDYGQTRLVSTRPEVVKSASGFSYIGATDNGPLKVNLAKTLCHDSMSGMPYPQRVEVSYNEVSLQGCAGSPATLLQTHEWVVEDINARGVIDNTHVTLNFGKDGRVYGHASCNRYTGTYELTGETLTIGALASTQMACAPALNQQETRFLDILKNIYKFDIDETGGLVLQSKDLRQILAR